MRVATSSSGGRLAPATGGVVSGVAGPLLADDIFRVTRAGALALAAALDGGDFGVCGELFVG